MNNARIVNLLAIRDVSKFSRAPVQLLSKMSAFSEKRRFNRISVNFRFWHKVTFQRLFYPVKRAGGLAGFEVLSRGDRARSV
jgi:hypothetical protein